MTFENFLSTCESSVLPKDLSIPLQSLWLLRNDDWHAAHDLIDHLTDLDSAYVHAYLHRVEGDLWNARYWYKQAKQPECKLSLADEWEHLVRHFLSK